MKKMFPLICKCLALGLSVSVLILSILKQIEPKDSLFLISIAMVSLSLLPFLNKK
ncbi:MAG: hypothetical protein IJ270_06300 [Paludibacteraceae bacterium]|nr:hypothetical protein [Paludibacteraceae bacterium]